MQRFKDYLKESLITPAIPLTNVETDYVLSNLDKANEDLDKVTDTTFVNSAIFVNAVRGTLERYGIVLPAESHLQQLQMEAEYIYAIGAGHYVYVVHNLTEEGAVEGYAQIVDQEELDDLNAMDGEEHEEDSNTPPPVAVDRYPPARRDDDSGNTNEYP